MIQFSDDSKKNRVLYAQKAASGKEMRQAGFSGSCLDMTLSWQLEQAGIPESRENTDPERLLVEKPDCVDEILKKIPRDIERYGVHPGMLVMPCYLPDTRRDDLDGLIRELTMNLIRFGSGLGIDAFLLSPIRSQKKEEVMDYFLSVAGAVSQTGGRILLKNQYRLYNGQHIRGFCSEPEEAVMLLKELNRKAGRECFGLCLDVGAASLCGMDMEYYVRTAGDQLKAVILRDCDGSREASLMPFSCSLQGRNQTDWLGLVRGLRETDFSGDLVMECADTLRGFPPDIRSELLKLVKTIGDWFVWQIHIEDCLKRHRRRVLFGAGNMCRNYMKDYGEKYPPLFTCDNDKKIWGKDFCGLEVRPPKALKELDPDVAVVICNLHYEEITDQLCEMGLDNPVEYFNDYYMPTFHYERIIRNWETI